MPLTIGSNIQSLQALRRLDDASRGLATVFERLSSGQRINRASDDAAGLAVATQLSANRRVYAQGIRNYNDGLSLLNLADSAIEQLSTIVLRIRELAEQAANGTFSSVQRGALDTEAQELSEEFFRISRSTEFNGLNLLNGSFAGLRLQGEYGENGGIQSTLGGAVGTGTFSAGGTYQMGASTTTGLATGDLNGDGILDLVAIDQTGGTGSVRLGNGDGTFGAIMTIGGGGGTGDVVVLGDLNGDGHLDIVSDSSGGVVVQLGNGNGTFGSVSTFAAATKIFDLRLGDINGDSILDIAVASYGGLLTLTGDGGGGFGAATSYANTHIQQSISLADLDGDGDLDVVAGGNIGGTGAVQVRLNQGGGLFGAAATYSNEADQTYDIEIADLNGDGRLDLITGGDDGASSVATVRFGNGLGGFGAATEYTAENNVTFDISVNDINGDGFLDLITAGSTDAGTSSFSVRLGTGTGSFGSSISYDNGPSTARSLVVNDFNRDGVPDIITAGFTGAGGFAQFWSAATTPGVSPLLPFSLATSADARQAMGLLDNKLNSLSQQRGTIGAFQSRVSVAVGVLGAMAENTAAAESRILDVDVAEETANLTRLQILRSAAAAVMAQANLQPQLALKLLGVNNA